MDAESEDESFEGVVDKSFVVDVESVGVVGDDRGCGTSGHYGRGHSDESSRNDHQWSVSVDDCGCNRCCNWTRRGQSKTCRGVLNPSSGIASVYSGWKEALPPRVYADPCYDGKCEV